MTTGRSCPRVLFFFFFNFVNLYYSLRCAGSRSKALHGRVGLHEIMWSKIEFYAKIMREKQVDYAVNVQHFVRIMRDIMHSYAANFEQLFLS